MKVYKRGNSQNVTVGSSINLTFRPNLTLMSQPKVPQIQVYGGAKAVPDLNEENKSPEDNQKMPNDLEHPQPGGEDAPSCPEEDLAKKNFVPSRDGGNVMVLGAQLQPSNGNRFETQSNVSGVSKGTTKGSIAQDKHCLAPECLMKKIPGNNWPRHVKNEIHGGKLPEHRRCNGEGCISCEEAKEMKKKKCKYFCRATHFGSSATHFGSSTLLILVAARYSFW
jgi:hypothetical protein